MPIDRTGFISQVQPASESLTEDVKSVKPVDLSPIATGIKGLIGRQKDKSFAKEVDRIRDKEKTDSPSGVPRSFNTIAAELAGKRGDFEKQKAFTTMEQENRVIEFQEFKTLLEVNDEAFMGAWNSSDATQRGEREPISSVKSTSTGKKIIETKTGFKIVDLTNDTVVDATQDGEPLLPLDKKGTEFNLEKKKELAQFKADLKSGTDSLQTGTAAELFSILSTSDKSEDRERARKMQEFTKLSIDEVGKREREKREAQIATAADLEKQKQEGKGEISDKTQQDQSKKLVTNVLVDVKDLFRDLQAVGAAVDVKQGSIKNVINFIASSAVGQFTARAFGTEAQSIRNQLNQKEPILLNAIRQATKQGARGLDSDRELDFYLQAIADEGRDIDSQLAALIVLDEAYGLGVGVDIKVDNLDAQKRLLDRQAKDFDKSEGKTQKINNAEVDVKRKRLEELRKKKAGK